MAVDVNDATLPLDNSLTSPASEGAAEFRALKSKINSLYLSTGIGATFTKLIDTNGEGLNIKVTDASSVILYASRFEMVRSASAIKDSYGLLTQATLANSVSIGTGLFAGGTTLTQTGTGCICGLMLGLSSGVIQQTHNLNATIAGVYSLFMNRLTVGVAAPGGLGSNQYNLNSSAFLIDAWPRSSSGEYCGWKNGILFTAAAMDNDLNGGGYGFDISGITYVGAADPFTAYRTRAAIRLAKYQGIIWNGTNTNDLITYYDDASGRLTISKGGTKRWELDITTGQVYKNGVLQY